MRVHGTAARSSCAGPSWLPTVAMTSPRPPLTARPASIVVVAAALALLDAASGAARPASPADQDLVDVGVRDAARIPACARGTAGAPTAAPELSVDPEGAELHGCGLPHVGPVGLHPGHADVLVRPRAHHGARARSNGAVTLADIAPTQARAAALRRVHARPTARAMTEAIEPGDQTPPKLVVMLVWDAGGINVLRDAPRRVAVPEVADPEGHLVRPTRTVGLVADLDRAGSTRRSAPARSRSTTGSWAHHFQLGGQRHDAVARSARTSSSMPTLADLYDRAMGNKPVVGIVGDRRHPPRHARPRLVLERRRPRHRDDALGRPAATRRPPRARRGTSRREDGRLLPPPGLRERRPPGSRTTWTRSTAPTASSTASGATTTSSSSQQGFDTPARTAYQERVVEKVIRREGFGADDTPDLLYLNFKEIDYIGHIWSMNSPEMTGRRALRRTRRSRRSSPSSTSRWARASGRWCSPPTTPRCRIPAVSGGFEISTGADAAGDRTQFDTNGDATPIVDTVQPSQVFLNEDELRPNGYTVDDVARFVHDAHAGPDRGRRDRAEPRPGERPGVRGRVPVGADPEDLPCLPEAAKT